MLVSSLTLILDGAQHDPPPLALPPAASVPGSTAAAAADDAVGLGNVTAATLGCRDGGGTVGEASIAVSQAGAGAGGGLMSAMHGHMPTLPPGSMHGFPPTVTLIDEGVLLTLRRQLKAAASQMVMTHKAAQRQVVLQTRPLREALAASEARCSAALCQVEQLQAELTGCHAAAEATRQQVGD